MGLSSLVQRGISNPQLHSHCSPHAEKNNHFVWYTLGNQFQSPGDFLGSLSAFILWFLIYAFDLHTLNILSSF